MFCAYMAFGDSVTAGMGDPVKGIETRAWADWVADSLATLVPKFSYTNLGRAGSTTRDVLREQLPLVLDRKPDLVSVTTGANDARSPAWSIDTFFQEYSDLLKPISEQGAVILTMAYPDLITSNVKRGNQVSKQWQLYFQRMQDINAVIREVSAKVDACLLDLENYAPTQDPTHISTDRVHPNALGHKLAGDAALQLLIERYELDLWDKGETS